MLKLKRRVGEEIVIDEDTRVIVGKAGPANVELLIDAPRSVHVRRGELRPEAEQLIQDTAKALGVAG